MTTFPDRVAGDPFAGTTLDARYRLDDLIGRGGMAAVYRGEDLTLGRPVAVKVFAASAEGIDDLERRKSEIALLASLSHRALVRLYDASHDAVTGREYLVMELIDGEDLRQALRRGPVSSADAAALLADVGEALHVIHGRGIVHRDVKPANVLLEPAHLPTRTWNAKLADFGIARLIDDARLTRTGLLVGTPGYLSPEQVSGGAPPGPEADVYSLGLLVLEARTGQAAFPGPSAESAAARLVRDPEIPASLGDDWVALLRAMTARDPAQRPTALDVALAAIELDTSGATAAVTGRRTAATVAMGAVAAPEATEAADPADAPTLKLGAPVAGASVPSVTASAASPSPAHAAAGATASTRVIPDASQAERAVAAAMRPAPRRSAARWVRPAIGATLLAGIAIAAALLLPGAITASSTPEPSLAPLPSVPGELGVHLEELDEAVTG